MKKQVLTSLTAILFVVSFLIPGQIQAARAQGQSTYPNVGGQAVRQSIIYKAPVENGTSMTVSNVVSHFEMLIYARDSMLRYLSSYEQAGWNGLSLLYIDSAKNNGPSGLSSLTAQKTPCTTAQQSLAVYTNTITMDTGEFCRIHNAAITNGTLDGIPVTEAWFLHKSDGSRYEVTGGGVSGASQYRMNLSNPDYQKYVIYKLQREFSATDPTHLPTGAAGLFFDNVSESWNDILNLNGGNPPKEYADKTAYHQGVASFLAQVHNAYPSIPIWGNMTSFSTNMDNFTIFKPYLAGAMIEGAFLNWDGTPRSSAQVESGNLAADQWGKPLLYVVQGDSAGTYHEYTFGLYLLMANDDAYFFFRDHSSYANYYEIPDYSALLGQPLGPRTNVSSGVWTRQFENGSVLVDMNAHTSTITINSNGSPTPTVVVSPTVTATPGYTPTSTVTPVITPTVTASPTATVIPGSLSPGMYDDTNSGLHYSGAWTVSTNAKAFDGNQRYSTGVNDTAAFTFTGSKFTLYFDKANNHGKVNVFVDGIQTATINQYSAKPAFQKIWRSVTYPTGVHTVKLVHTSGKVVSLDGVQIYSTTLASTPVLTAGMYDDKNKNISYKSSWGLSSNTKAYLGSMHISKVNGNSSTFAFTGQGFSLYYATNTHYGKLVVYVDGALVAAINEAGTTSFKKLWVSPPLTDGVHSVTLLQIGGGVVNLDAIQVYAGTPPTP